MSETGVAAFNPNRAQFKATATGVLSLIAHFFPNQSPEDMELELELRQVAAQLPEAVRLELYEAFSNTRATFQPTTFRKQDGMVLADQKGKAIAFPSPVPLIKLSHIVFGYEELLLRKYSLPEFVEVEPGDLVIDCGAFVGGFSLGASQIARQVHCFEPSLENHRCLNHNLGRQANVVLNIAGLYSETKSMTLNISESGVEHSLLAPDDGPPIATHEIQVYALQDYCRSAGIQTIDFCKIEAEGVELEVFEGLGDLRPRKLAIDVSPEREGQIPSEEFRRRLISLGYDVRQRHNVLFARRRSELRSDFPKCIYSLWIQGREQAPDIVRFNFERWEALNPEYEVKVLDGKDVERLLSNTIVDIGSISPQALSDLVRLKLLKDHGGIWADASVLPLVPLDEWLPAAMKESSFFAFEREDVPLSSWFLCASPGSEIMARWWQEAERLWSRPRIVSDEIRIPENPAEEVSEEGLSRGAEIPYFWVHCLFQYMLEHEARLTDIWGRSYRSPAGPCHDLQNLFKNVSTPSDHAISEAAFRAPVQKLEWRFAYPLHRFQKLLTKGKPVTRPSLYRQIRKSLHPLRAQWVEWNQSKGS